MNHRDLVFEREGRNERLTDEYPSGAGLDYWLRWATAPSGKNILD